MEARKEAGSLDCIRGGVVLVSRVCKVRIYRLIVLRRSPEPPRRNVRRQALLTSSPARGHVAVLVIYHVRSRLRHVMKSRYQLPWDLEGKR